LNVVDRQIALGRGEVRYERIVTFDHVSDPRNSLIEAVAFLHNSADKLILGGKIPERISIEYDRESWQIKMTSYVNQKKSETPTGE